MGRALEKEAYPQMHTDKTKLISSIIAISSACFCFSVLCFSEISVHQCTSVVPIPLVSLLPANEIGVRLAAADYAEAAAGDEHFGRTRPGIVV